MGCGAGKYAADGPTHSSSIDDPKLREYLRMKGADPDALVSQQPVGVSPAQARRQGLSAGQTPGTSAREESTSKHQTKSSEEEVGVRRGQVKPSRSSQNGNRETDYKRQSSSGHDRSRSSKGAKRNKNRTSSRQHSSDRREKGKAPRNKNKNDSSQHVKRSRSRRDLHSNEHRTSKQEDSTKPGRSGPKDHGSSSSRRHRDRARNGASKNSSRSGPRDVSETFSHPRSTSNDISDVDDDAKLSNYLKMSSGRRNAMPPPPGDLMAILQKM